jgi:Hom_end-associated Hint/Type III restriction enzyme, res subunit
MLTTTGYKTAKNPELKKKLTVRAVENALGIRPPAFRVFREAGDNLVIPRYFGCDEVGPPTRDTRPDPARARIDFNGSLRDATRQPESVQRGKDAFERVGGGVLSLPCGYGKCHGKDTKIMMFDGSIKMIQDIVPGELVMGDDSTPRTVLSTCTGYEQMYRVVPTKGEPYEVNESHILSLKYVQKRHKKHGQVLDISVLDYLKLSDSFKHTEVRGYRVPVTFPHKEVPLDPYMFGYWLGDGVSKAAMICCQDSTVLHYFHRNLGKYDLHLDFQSKYDYRIKGPKPNLFFKTLKELGVIGNKHIPTVYKCNSRQVQLQVLAGLIDSDGSAINGGWDFIQKNEKLFDDVLFLCRSLGFACYKTCTNAPGGPKKGTYFRCTITGKGVEDVPCKVPRKRLEPREQIKDVLSVGIKLEKLDVGQYFGFELDGNHRYVLGDFTVTHNTTCALALAAHLKVRTMIVVHKEFLANQWAERIKEFCPGSTIGRVQCDKLELENDFVIAMIQTMCTREHEPDAFTSIGLVIVDEAHHIGAPAFSQFMFKLCPKYTLGLTATPERKDGLTRLLYWFMGPNFFTVERENQKQVMVVPVNFDCPEYREAPPLSRIGKINLAEVVNRLADNPARNKIILKIVEDLKKENRKILILSDRREHCFWLTEHIEGSGLYIGGMKEEELAQSEKQQVIVATFTLAHEGLDIPALDTVILSTPHSDVKQAVGRIMRETKGKLHDPVIYDFVDNWSVLWAMYNKRLKMYQESGFAIKGYVPKKKEEIPKKCLI